jgi:hypothetical protein
VIRMPAYHVHFMGRHHYRHARCDDVADDRHDLGARERVEVRDELVREEHPWLLHQGAGDGHALPLAA